MDMPCVTRWHKSLQLSEDALLRVAARASEALAARGVFHIVLSGGNTPRELYMRLATLETDWSRWQIWFGDERCLPGNHVERNSRMAGEVWLDASPIPRAQIHVIPAESGAKIAAQQYAQQLAGVAEFDLVLLGLGEDGHTASLFPGQVEQDSAQDAVPVFAAPKPPPERVSLSVRRLSHAREILFLVNGRGKRVAVADWKAGKAIPAALVCPAQGVDVLITPDALP